MNLAISTNYLMSMTFFIGPSVKDLVKQIVEAVTGMMSNVESLATLAMQSPEQMAGGMYKSIMEISANSVAPIAESILTLFLMIELANIFRRQEARGVDSIYFIAVIFLKVGVAKSLMEHIDLIVQMAFSVTTEIGEPIHTNMAKLEADSQGELTEALTTALDGSNEIWRMIVGMLVVIFQLFDWLLNALCQIVIYLRFIEIFIFAAIGPIPVATWPSKEYNSVFRNWIKRIIGLSLHAVLILLCLWFYVSAINEGFSLTLLGAPADGSTAEWLISTSADGHWVYAVLGYLVSILGSKIMLIIALFQTSGWAKSLAGAA